MARRSLLVPALVVAGLAGLLAAGVAVVGADRVRTDERLRAELVAMAAADQKERLGDPTAPGGPRDQVRTDRLREIVDRHGWPTASLAGQDGADAAWLIAQHADTDVAFQQRALELMRQAAEQDEASWGNVAYLTDRVAANTRQPQTFGTQVGCEGGEPTPGPIADEAGVDERRRAVGLPPLADYLAGMAAMCAAGPGGG